MKFFNLNSYIFLIIILLFSSCFGDNDDVDVSMDYSKYISAFTSDVISNNDNIVVELAGSLTDDQINSLDLDDLFEITPYVEGEVSIKSNNTFIFSPNESLNSGENYVVSFNLGEVFDVSSELNVFKFQFKIRNLYLDLQIGEFTPIGDDNKWQKVTGKLISSDIVDDVMVKKIINASQNGKKLKVNWVHGPKEHIFTIDSVSRKKTRQFVKINSNATFLGIEHKKKINYEIPPLGDFVLVKTEINHLPNQFMKLIFSDPLSKNTNLKGLVFLESNEGLEFSINKNIVTVYPKNKLVGKKILRVSDNIKNSKGADLLSNYSEELNFISIKPQVSLIGDGVILPSSNGLIFPFKAVNLKSVNVKIIKIFENNVSQFFQSNSLDGSYNLNRVGRLIYKDDVVLESDKPIDYNDWNNFALDLKELIEVEPGAIYRVVLSFKMSQSLYPCDCDDYSEYETDFTFEDKKFDNNQYWSSSSNYNYQSVGYNWRERDDPCKITYYNQYNNLAQRNVFASDLGIITKASPNGDVVAFVTNMISTNPESGVKVDLYNFQNQIIQSQVTNSDGIAKFNIDAKPFYLIAKKDNVFGYLKLDDGSSLSMSMFEISGSSQHDGVNGYIYADRGVWRPGDSLFISFILEDKNKTLPVNHPVTFTLYNAKGQVYNRITKNVGINGFYVFRTKTEHDDETGYWNAEIKLGDKTFKKSLRIETVKPNRLKVMLDYGGDMLTKYSRKPIKITSKWLHGAPAKNLKANLEINLSEYKTKFNDYVDYNFDDYIKSFSTQNLPISEIVLDENGEANISPRFNVSDAPGILKTSFKVRVFEKSGDASVYQDIVKYSPFSTYVGFKMPEGRGWSGAIMSDKKNLIPIATVNENGSPISRKRVKIEIFKLDWDWWWETSYKSNIARFVTGNSRDLIYTDYVSTKDGKAIYELNLNQNLHSRCYIRVTDPISNHSSGEVFYLTYGGYWNTVDARSEGAEMLDFNTDKKKYSVGEEINITLPNASKGRVLISVESGDEILETLWYEVKKGKNVYKIKAKPEMAPNIYLNITFIQPHGNTLNDLPIRMYGVKGISVEDPNTHLKPEIAISDELRPNEKVSMKISEKNGKPMTYTIAVVDDGLLDLTNFRTPNPWSRFYSKQSLGIKTWDMYKYVSGAFVGKFAGLLEIGGDEYVKNENNKTANRFKPVVKFLGPFNLKAGRTNSHSFDMPNYIGSVRTMIVAADGGAYGSSSKTSLVKKPLMVLSTLPRVVGPTEEVELPVTVFVGNDLIKNVQVKVESNDKIDILGTTVKKIRFSKQGEKMVFFKLKVKDELGVAKVKVTCGSDGETAIHNIELNVRMPNPMISKVTSKILNPGESLSLNYKAIGIGGTNTGIVEFSSLPPINLEKRLDYLIRYPHGCIEQTTSSVFPQLSLDNLVELTDVQNKEIQKNISEGLNRLISFQNTSGGFTYWPNSRNSSASEWGTNYAGHFMLEAKKSGYRLPINILDKWLEYQNDMANRWENDRTGSNYYRRSTQLNQAYRLYTLALAGKPALSAMNKMLNISELSDISRWRLAGAYHLIGRNDIADRLINNADMYVDNYKGSSYTYGSKTRDEAMILEILSMLDRRSDGKKLMDNICQKLSSDDYMSTQTTSFSLLAVTKYIGNSDNNSKFKFSYQNKNIKKDVVSNSTYYHLHLDNLEENKSGKFEVKNTSKGLLYVNLNLKGIPMYDGIPMNIDNKIKMDIGYYDMDNRIIDPSEIEQGNDFYAKVEINNGSISDYENLALTQIFPSGWEIRNTRMDLTSVVQNSNFDYQDFRDDRVLTYFNLKRGEKKVFRVSLNASYLGKFYLPAFNCEAMYDNSVNATEGGEWVNVIKNSD